MVNRYAEVARDFLRLHEHARDGFDEIGDKSSEALSELAHVRDNQGDPDAWERFQEAMALLQEAVEEQDALTTELCEMHPDVPDAQDILG